MKLIVVQCFHLPQQGSEQETGYLIMCRSTASFVQTIRRTTCGCRPAPCMPYVGLRVRHRTGDGIQLGKGSEQGFSIA
jgi:hypothetical protein